MLSGGQFPAGTVYYKSCCCAFADRINAPEYSLECLEPWRNRHYGAVVGLEPEVESLFFGVNNFKCASHVVVPPQFSMRHCIGRFLSVLHCHCCEPAN